MLTRREALRRARIVVSRLQPGPIVALDAGCGSFVNFPLPPGSTQVGLDVSQEALSRADLDEGMLADLNEPIDLKSRFDLIVCCDVIEHLRNPVTAMENLRRGMHPGSLLVLAAPSLYSMKGIATKLTPHRIHVWYYRHVLKRTKEEGGPYPTFMPHTMSAGYVRRFLDQQGLNEQYFTFYESGAQSALRTRWPLLRYPWAALRGFLWLFGHDLEASDWMGVYSA